MNKLLEPTKEMIEAGQIAGNLQYAKVIRSYEAMISKSETIPKLLAVVEALEKECYTHGVDGVCDCPFCNILGDFYE